MSAYAYAYVKVWSSPKEGEFKNHKLEKLRLNFSSYRNPDIAPFRTDLSHSLRKRTETPRLFANTELTATCYK